MSDQGPDSLMLRYLRAIDAKMDRLSKDMRDLRTRMTTLEQQAGNLAATEASHYGSIASRIDGVTAPLYRIERRLDLVAHPG